MTFNNERGGLIRGLLFLIIVVGAVGYFLLKSGIGSFDVRGCVDVGDVVPDTDLTTEVCVDHSG